MDFGVYDLRNENTAAKNATFASQHASFKEQAFYAVCWLDWLGAKDSAAVRKLPPGDQINGAKSDYCR